MGRAVRRLTAKRSQSSSRFPLFRVVRRVQHEDSNRCVGLNHYFRDGNADFDTSYDKEESFSKDEDLELEFVKKVALKTFPYGK